MSSTGKRSSLFPCGSGGEAARMTTDTPAYRLTERADLLGYAPYLLGFHPADSVVVMGLRGDRIVVAARADVAGPRTETVRRFAQVLRAAGRGRDAVGSVVLLGYGPGAGAADATRHAADALDARGYHVREVLLQDGDRYHCLQCDRCTPAEGARFDPSATAAAAMATYEGLVALPDRDAVERQVEPVGGLAAAAMTQAVDRAEERLAALLADGGDAALVTAGEAAVEAALDVAGTGGRLDDDAAAWLIVLLHDLRCRDHAWQRTDAAAWQHELWLDLTRRAEPALAAPPAALLAWSAWRAGNGVLARAALDRALHADPAYSLAHLLTDALDRAVPPHSIHPWP
ncbi:DUF4192 domain-containing protein [Saccharothrix algeriensis]|uniref:DUF4192 domain-containing protein n=2 Tax=Catellatospora bangladeshensis TaxID=310355 RepID=A0A8J3NKY7_9ACTN|nr:hypothetical protein Cba03nite_58410 [Catellatospora bangladeshensis]